jgi:hypothetical protein
VPGTSRMSKPAKSTKPANPFVCDIPDNE